MTTAVRHRLEGLEPDNLLAFLALLGLLRALEATDRDHPEGELLWPRAAWDIDNPPLRPVLCLARHVTPRRVAEIAAQGVNPDLLAALMTDGAVKDQKKGGR